MDPVLATLRFIAPYLTISELGRLSRCSRSYREHIIAGNAWVVALASAAGLPLESVSSENAGDKAEEAAAAQHVPGEARHWAADVLQLCQCVSVLCTAPEPHGPAMEHKSGVYRAVAALFQPPPGQPAAPGATRAAIHPMVSEAAHSLFEQCPQPSLIDTLALQAALREVGSAAAGLDMEAKLAIAPRQAWADVLPTLQPRTQASKRGSLWQQPALSNGATLAAPPVPKVPSEPNLTDIAGINIQPSDLTSPAPLSVDLLRTYTGSDSEEDVTAVEIYTDGSPQPDSSTAARAQRDSDAPGLTPLTRELLTQIQPSPSKAAELPRVQQSASAVLSREPPSVPRAPPALPPAAAQALRHCLTAGALRLLCLTKDAVAVQTLTALVHDSARRVHEENNKPWQVVSSLWSATTALAGKRWSIGSSSSRTSPKHVQPRWLAKDRLAVCASADDCAVLHMHIAEQPVALIIACPTAGNAVMLSQLAARVAHLSPRSTSRSRPRDRSATCGDPTCPLDGTAVFDGAWLAPSLPGVPQATQERRVWRMRPSAVRAAAEAMSAQMDQLASWAVQWALVSAGHTDMQERLSPSALCWAVTGLLSSAQLTQPIVPAAPAVPPREDSVAAGQPARAAVIAPAAMSLTLASNVLGVAWLKSLMRAYPPQAIAPAMGISSVAWRSRACLAGPSGQSDLWMDLNWLVRAAVRQRHLKHQRTVLGTPSTVGMPEVPPPPADNLEHLPELRMRALRALQGDATCLQQWHDQLSMRQDWEAEAPAGM